MAFADRIPNEQAVAISPTVGWLLLATAVCAALVFILAGDRWRRWWLSAEDPRGIAVFRIVFAFFVIANINDMWEHLEFLYTDEGIFPADVARQVFAAEQFAGFGDGFTADDPWGFYDLAAFWEFVKGPRWSLLFFWDSPAFFWAHMVAFYVAAVSLLVGFRTRTMGVLTWFLMNGILVRNNLAWEGTELVSRCVLADLVVARSGHAYSVDNWLRCRKLKRQGRLGEGEAVYRLIPSWPRKLIMLQLATIYFTTGALKNGSVWMSGDSLYYALNLDHFYRVPPQLLSSMTGTTLFRGMTYAVKFGQMLFPLVLVGIVVRWQIAQRFPEIVGWRRWGLRAAYVGLVGLTTAIGVVTWPVHFTPPIPAWAFGIAWVLLWAGVWLLWRKLTIRPWVIRGVVIDRVFVCKWLLGRRVLLVWHIAFHAHIFTLMNVGQFQTGMLAATFAFIEGREIATMLRDIASRLARWGVPFVSALAGPVLAAEDPMLPKQRRDDARLPMWSVIVALGAVIAGIVVQVRFAPEWDYRLLFAAAAAFLAGVALVQWRRSRGTTIPEGVAPWAYGPLGRLLVGGLIAWHLTAVAVWLIPDKDCVSTFRPQARKVFAFWLTRTTTDQGWGMFAPNPPRSNVFLKVLVTDASGEVWDLRTDVYAEEQKPIPWIWNTRLRKMNRRIIGGESGDSEWYRKWYARWECRQWAREHGGEAPRNVQLVKVWYAIPSPEETRRKGYYVAEDLLARTGHERVTHVETCDHAVMGQLPNVIRERDGLPLLETGEYRPWIKHKRRRWEQRRGE